MDLLSNAAKSKFRNAMYDLEDTFAKSTISLKVFELTSTRFVTAANSPTTLISGVKAMVNPRTTVNESNIIDAEQTATAEHQQLEIHVFQREALSKGLINTSNEITFNIENTKLVYLGDDYIIEQCAIEGYMGSSLGELLKFRVTRAIDTY